MFKVIMLLAVIAAVYSVPAPQVQNVQSATPLELPVDGSIPSFAGDNKEVLEKAESAYVELNVAPVVAPYPYYPVYYPGPIVYQANPRHHLRVRWW